MAVVVGALVVAAAVLASSYLGSGANHAGSSAPATTTQLVTITSTATSTSVINHTSTVTITTLVVTTLTQTVTNTAYTSINSNDTFLTQCTVTGIGGLEVRIVSDSNGVPVNGETITASDKLGCDIVGQPPETQTVYLSSFTSGTGGWLTPVWPQQAESGGQLTFTVAYQGATYNFAEYVPPIGTLCATLHVPSGNVTTSTVMNGSGSYCS
jgi:hypothetical protein